MRSALVRPYEYTQLEAMPFCVEQLNFKAEPSISSRTTAARDHRTTRRDRFTGPFDTNTNNGQIQRRYSIRRRSAVITDKGLQARTPCRNQSKTPLKRRLHSGTMKRKVHQRVKNRARTPPASTPAEPSFGTPVPSHSEIVRPCLSFLSNFL